MRCKHLKPGLKHLAYMPLCANDHTAIRLIVHFYLLLAVHLKI